MLWDQMTVFLKSFFIYSGVEWNMVLVAIGLGVAFGAIWLWAHWPPLFKKHWLWGVAVFSAFFTLLAVVFVQIPLRHWAGQALTHFWSTDTLNSWLLLAGIPQILIGGLVQEGAKMVPVVLLWWRNGKSITPKMGLAIGALAGAGFGIFEAVWAHNWLFAAGWTLDAISTDGFLGIAGFWERFFVVGFHISAAALAGYGLAKGKGWQFYLLAAVLHGILNYAVVLLFKEYITLVQLEVWVAVVAVLVAAAVLILRWCRDDDDDDDAVVEPVEPEEEDF